MYHEDLALDLGKFSYERMPLLATISLPFSLSLFQADFLLSISILAESGTLLPFIHTVSRSTEGNKSISHFEWKEFM